MSSERIQVELGAYERLEILRDEKKSLSEQITQVERSIREILREVERQKYLQSLCPHYRTLQAPEGVHRLDQLEQLRASIVQAVDAIDTAYAAAEQQAGGAAPVASRPAGGQRPQRYNPDRR